MTFKPLPLALLAACLVGCSQSAGEDSAPLPAKDTQTRVEGATQNVAASNMTPEQKKAAEEYLKQGAAGAAKMKESAQQAGAIK